MTANLDLISSYSIAHPFDLGAQALDATGDPHLAAGLHFRLLVHPQLGLPLAPLRVFRLHLPNPGQNAGLHRRDIEWRNAQGQTLFPPFDVTPESPVTGYLPAYPDTCVWLEVLAVATSALSPGLVLPVSLASGSGRVAAAATSKAVFVPPPQPALRLDAYTRTTTGRMLVATRATAPFRLAASPIDQIVVSGRGRVTGVRWLNAGTVLDRAIQAALPAWRILALPVTGGSQYQGGLANARAVADDRVSRGAPRRYGMHDRPGSASPAACPTLASPGTAELQRLMPMTAQMSAHLTALTSTTTPETLTTPLNASDTQGNFHVGLRDSVFQSTHDPGIARWLGLLDVDTAPPASATGDVVAYIIGGRFAGSRMLDPDGGFRPAAAVACAIVGNPPAAPPVVSAGTPASSGWLPRQVPEARRQVVVPVRGFLDGAGAAFARVVPGASVAPLNVMNGDRANVLLPGATDADPGLAELLDRNAPAQACTYRVAQHDLFGRWSEWAEVPLPAGQRPAPPAPALQASYRPPSVPAPMPTGLMAGTIRARVPVPAVAALPPGGHLLDRLVLALDGVVTNVPVGTSSEIAVDLPGPALERAGERTVVLTARFVDQAGVASTDAEPRTLVLRDPRPAPAPSITPGLRYTSRPDATGRARAAFAFPVTATQRALRVFYSDENRIRHGLGQLAAAGGPNAGRAAAALADLAAAPDAPNRAAVVEREAALLERAWFEPIGTPIEPQGSEARVEHDLPASLAILSFYRVVVVSAAQVESPFAEAPLAAVAVARDVAPQRPFLLVVTEPPAPGQPLAVKLTVRVPRGTVAAAEFRILRQIEGDGAAGMPVIATGPMPLAADGVQHVEYRDLGSSSLAPAAVLRPFVRYVWRAQVRAAPAPGNGPSGAWSEPSQAVSATLIPPEPPAAVTALEARPTKTSGAVTLRFNHPLQRFDGGHVGRYTIEIERQPPGERAQHVLTLQPDLPSVSPGKNGTFSVTDPSAPPSGTRYLVRVLDPIGRPSLPATCVFQRPV